MMMLHIGLACQMEQGTKAMHLNRWKLHDTTTSMYATMKYFNARAITWSYITCKSYSDLAKHVASLPAHRCF